MKKILCILFSISLLLACDKIRDKKNLNIENKVKEDSSLNIKPENYNPKTTDEKTAQKIKDFLISDFLKDDIANLEKSDRRFQFYSIDLNHDGTSEIFIRFMSSYFCGSGGCTFLLLDSDFKIITKFSVTRAPIFVEKLENTPWSILLVKDQGVFKELKYDGASYPNNPSILPKAPYDAPSGHAEILFDEYFSKAKTYEF